MRSAGLFTAHNSTHLTSQTPLCNHDPRHDPGVRNFSITQQFESCEQWMSEKKHSPNWYDMTTPEPSDEALQPFLPETPRSTISPLLNSIHNTTHRNCEVNTSELIRNVSAAIVQVPTAPTASSQMTVGDAIRTGTGVIQRLKSAWFNPDQSHLPGNHEPGDGQAPAADLCRASVLHEKALSRCRLSQYELIDPTSGDDRLQIAVPVAVACLSLVNLQQAWAES